MNIEQIRKELQDRQLHKIAKATGLHVNTIRGIRDGFITDPRLSTVQALADYLEGKNNASA